MLSRWIPAWVVPVTAALAVGSVALRLSVVRTTYEIGRADRALRELQQAKEQMEVEVARLRSPRRLEALARARYDLAPPRPEQILHAASR